VLVQLAARIAQRARSAKLRGECLTVGLCGAQGSGKSTLTPVLKRLLEERGLMVAMLSLDDFYLPLSAREALARIVHPLLKTRGVPGTHDVDLALQVIAGLRREGTVSLPAFDKACDDRRPPSEWPRARAPVDVILFEGWCVGALPQPQECLSLALNSLEREEDTNGIWRRHVNHMLAEAYQSLFRDIGFLILLAAPSFDVVYQWRLEQENELRCRVAEEGGDASRLMSDVELERFICHYERLTRHILAEMPARADIVVSLDAQRRMTITKAFQSANAPRIIRRSLRS
jgi:D-glycerate 3-kinase